MLYMVSIRGLICFFRQLRLWTALGSLSDSFFAERQLLRGSTVLVTSQLPPLLISLRIRMHVILCSFSFIRLFSIVFCLNSLYFRFRQPFSSSSSAEGRTEGSFSRQLSTIARSSGGQSRGRGAQGEWRTLCLSSARSLPVKGWFQVSISQSRQPKAQISEWQEQGSCCHISGLVQQGVPILVVAMPFLLTALTFMSPSFTVLSSPRKKLAAFTSRWITCVRCSACSPCSISLARAQTSSSGKGARSRLRRIMKWRKSPLRAYSVTRQRLSCSKKAYLQAMM